MMGPVKSQSIPVVDFTSYRAGSDSDKRRIANEIDRAFSTTGFLYLKNPGITAEKVDEAFEWNRRFFALGEVLETAVPRQQHRGYDAAGKEEVRGQLCLKANFDIGNPDDGLNLWPEEDMLPGFRSFMEDFYKDCSRVIRDVLAALTLALDLPSSTSPLLTKVTSDFVLALLHYPSVPYATFRDGTSRRFPAHSDFGLLTLLFQDHVGGLQIAERGSASDDKSATLDREGHWIDVPPLEGTVIVNVGYLLDRWSNGRWKAAVHRVVEPPHAAHADSKDGDITPERFSIPFFAAPDEDAVIEALPGCHSETVPKRWKPLHAGQYLDRKRNGVYVKTLST